MPWHETAAERMRARAERPLKIPTPMGALFGVLTPAAPEAPPTGRCIVLLTRPRSHRNRMWVEAARTLAVRGSTCFRFDYHGTGDSGGVSGPLDPNRPYRNDGLAVLEYLRAREGQTRFVLVGSCFDARVALSCFAAHGDAIDGLVFMAAPVVELDTLVKADADRKDWKHLVRALGNRENWKALASSERWRYMATVTGRVARRSLANGAGEALPLAASFLADFEALRRSRARALFLYGAADKETEAFRIAEARLFPRLAPAERARFEIEVWPGEVHGFLEVPRQRETLERVLAWIAALPAAASGAEAAWTSA